MQFCVHAEKPQGNGLLLYVTQRYVFIITKTCVYVYVYIYIYILINTLA